MAQLVKTCQGLAIASVKTVNNLAIASCQTIQGVDNTAGGMTIVATDNFNAYDDADHFVQLDTTADWVNVSADQLWVYNPTGSAGTVYAAISNSERCIRNVATVNADHAASLTIIKGGFGSNGIGPAIRCQSGANSWYAAVFYRGIGLYLLKCNAGTVATVTNDAVDYATGTIFRVSAVGAGSSTRLTVEADTGGGFSDVFSNQDPGGSYLDNGFTGMVGYGDAQASCDGDDFVAWNV